MKILKFFGKLLLIILAVMINTVEGLILAATYSLWFIGFILHEVFKKVSEWVVAITKHFNFVSIFRRYEE